MKPVQQTITGDQGNCLAACIATVMELPIEAVPNFIVEDDWRGAVQSFLRPFGFAMVCCKPARGDLMSEIVPGGLMLICGRTDSKTWHATVGRGGEVIFDPYPGGAPFVADDREYELFVSLDPKGSPSTP